MHTQLSWQCLPFSDLSATQLYAILKARSEVFVVEQNCVYLDMDGVDPLCQHLVAWTPAQEVAAYLRLVPPGIKFAEASLAKALFDFLYLRPLSGVIRSAGFDLAEELRLNLDEVAESDRTEFYAYVERSGVRKMERIADNFKRNVWRL